MDLRHPCPLRGVVVEAAAEAVQVLFMIDEHTWRARGGDSRRVLLGVSVPCEPWGHPRRLMVEFRAGSAARLYIEDVGERAVFEVEPATTVPVNDGIIAYFPGDSLDGLCQEKLMESVWTSGRHTRRGEGPVLLVS